MKIYVRASSSSGWERGNLKIEGNEISYEAKVFDEGSIYGINGSRISKLWITMDGEAIVSYDRGWDIEPEDRIAQKALDEILAMYS